MTLQVIRKQEKSIRISYIFNGALIAWGSRAQKLVSLSSTETELIALSEKVSEIMFCKMS